MAKGASALLKSSVSTFRSTALTTASAGVCTTGASGGGNDRPRSRKATTTAAAISNAVPHQPKCFICLCRYYTISRGTSAALFAVLVVAVEQSAGM
jgi:hypothetical protein